MGRVHLSRKRKQMASYDEQFELSSFPYSSDRLEKYLDLKGFLQKSLEIKSALKNTGKSLKSLEKSLNSTIFCWA